MKIVLFGGGNKATAVLEELIALKQDVVGVIYMYEDEHENIWYKRVQDLAKENNIPTYYRKDDIKVILNKLNPDIVFVVGWRFKISKEQYSIPPKGTIIFHDSLLPKYRGFAPMNWAIINGEKETGATMFYIAEGIDCGDIISQKRILISNNDDARGLNYKVTITYKELIREYFNLSAIELKGKQQNHQEATYCCKRVPDDGLIDWGKSSWEIYNLIRGLAYPYPNAFTWYGGNKYYIREAELFDDDKTYSGRIIGRVVEIIKDKGIIVLTGDGAILIKTINYKSVNYSADELIKSVKATLGR